VSFKLGLIRIFYFLTFIFLCETSWGQSLYPSNVSYVGDFSSSSDAADYWYINSGGVRSTESFDTYNGQHAMRVETASSCLIFNRDMLPFTKQSGTTYTVGFYLKGPTGNQITVSLKNSNNAPDEVSETQAIIHNDWAYYKFQLTSSSSSEIDAAKVKIKFEQSGIYHIDVIHVKDLITNDIHVNALTGSNGGDGSLNAPYKTIQQGIEAWNPGGFVYVMEGSEYRNNNFNEDINNISNYNNFSVVNLESNNVADADLYNPLVIRNYQNQSPVIRFDGSGGFVGKYNFLEISGFEIIGPNQNITYQEALDNRSIQDNYYKGRGIAIWEGHHINIFKNIVHDCPNSGIRINNGDYCIVSNNIVYNNTWWSANAESAIVFATVKEFDQASGIIKMRMVANLVYSNENRIPFYKFGSNACIGSGYGCSDYNKFVDGNGVYVTRNNQVNDSSGNPNPNHPTSDNPFDGYTYLANNVTYLNGINGIVVHKTDNAIVTNNTVFFNGANPVTNELPDSAEWYQNNSQGRQKNSGITVNNSKNAEVYNNIISTRRSDDQAFFVSGATVSNGGYVENIKRANNIIYNGICQNYCSGNVGEDYGFNEDINPLFIDESTYDLGIEVGSPAIGTGFSHDYLPYYDLSGNLRNPTSVDIGAYVETAHTLNIHSVDEIAKNNFYPNPSTGIVYIPNIHSGIIKIFSVSGVLITTFPFNNHYVEFNKLNKGVYFIQVNDFEIKKLIIK
jgi:parallel beta-helix repeat protein